MPHSLHKPLARQVYAVPSITEIGVHAYHRVARRHAPPARAAVHVPRSWLLSRLGSRLASDLDITPANIARCSTVQSIFIIELVVL